MFNLSLLYTVFIYIFGYVLAIWVSHIVVRKITKRYKPKDIQEGIIGAGAVIGILERIFTITFVLVGQYTAIALVIAAKSIARFEELKTKRFAEYYLIGTLSSMLCAIFSGLFTLWLLKMTL
jgi:hypothetical protein